MRKIVLMICLVILFLFSVNATAETLNYEDMSLEELQVILDSVQAEMARRQKLVDETETAASQFEVLDENETAASQFEGKNFTVNELINMCAAITREMSLRNNFEGFNVPVGEWTVGKHLNAGQYAILAKNQDGYIFCDFVLSRFGGSEASISGEAEPGFIHHIDLNDGDTVRIKYSEVVFSPGTFYPTYEGADYSQSLVNFSEYTDNELKLTYQSIMHILSGQDIPSFILECGIWVVGEDFPAGTYDIEAFLNASHGNYSFLLFSDSSDLNMFSADLSMFGYGDDRDTSAANIVLKEGDIIITDGCMAKLTASNSNVFFGPK